MPVDILAGPYEAIVIYGTCAMGFLMLDLCLSELIGIVPFAGGNYGYIRCSLGPFWGYLAACMEFAYYNFYNARAIGKISLLVSAASEADVDLVPLWAFLGMVFVVSLNMKGGNTFWVAMILVTLYTFALVLIFFSGAFAHVDFKKWALGHYYPKAKQNDGSIGNYLTYMQMVNRPNAFFIGLDILPLASLRVVDEAHNVPRALIVGWVVMFVLSMLTFFAVMCHYPGVNSQLKKTTFILQYGLQDAITVDPQYYPLFLLPPTVATAVGFMFGAGNQLAAMSESGLMPKFLRVRRGVDGIPVVAFLFCAVVQYVVYYCIYKYEPLIPSFASDIVNLASSGLFMFICISFIVFRFKFENMKGNFVNPLGVPGAVLGALYWGFFFVDRSDHRFQLNRKATKAFYIFMSIMLFYYFVYVQYVQFFSKEEQEKFMKVYILNANQKRKQSVVFKYINQFLQMTGIVKFMNWASALAGANSSLHQGETMQTSNRGSGGGILGMVASVISFNKVAVEENFPSKAESVVPAPSTHMVGNNEPFHPASVKASQKANRKRSSVLRSSLKNGSVRVGWSGKVLDERSSRKVFEVLLDAPTDDVHTAASMPEDSQSSDAEPLPAEELLEAFPEHFVPMMATDDQDAPMAEMVAISTNHENV